MKRIIVPVGKLIRLPRESGELMRLEFKFISNKTNRIKILVDENVIKVIKVEPDMTCIGFKINEQLKNKVDILLQEKQNINVHMEYN